jgi:fumarylacetoacetate (FAA) hydrolase
MLIVVSRDLRKAVSARKVAVTLQAALDDWKRCEPQLQKIYRNLNGKFAGEDFGVGSPDLWESSAPLLGVFRSLPPTFDVSARDLMAPLPRAYQWADASAYLSHVERVRRARGAEMPPAFKSDPLMYQGGSDSMLGANDPIEVADEGWGIDLEAEIGIVTDDVPMGCSSEQALQHIRLLVLINDVSLRNLTPQELAKGFGFFQSKSWTSFSPVAVTPDELGKAWDGKRVHGPVLVQINGVELGRPDAGVDMHFDFPALISHAARTRPLGAGSIIGAGTVSNHSRSVGVACLAEKRALETLDGGKPVSTYLRKGDRIRIEMKGDDGSSIFGAIEQVVNPARSSE